MSEAAPQAAKRSGDIDKALDVLRLLYDDSYTFGHDEEHGFWAMKHGNIGSIETADTAEELGRLLDDAEGTGR